MKLIGTWKLKEIEKERKMKIVAMTARKLKLVLRELSGSRTGSRLIKRLTRLS